MQPCSEFLFGYEDELACITEFGSPAPQKGEEKEDTDEFDADWEDDDDWMTFEDEKVSEDAGLNSRVRREIPSYRDPATGKCLWGLLRDLNNTEHETVRFAVGFVLCSALCSTGSGPGPPTGSGRGKSWILTGRRSSGRGSRGPSATESGAGRHPSHNNIIGFQTDKG